MLLIVANFGYSIRPSARLLYKRSPIRARHPGDVREHEHRHGMPPTAAARRDTAAATDRSAASYANGPDQREVAYLEGELSFGAQRGSRVWRKTLPAPRETLEYFDRHR
jgi:hypothetical protein